MKSIPILNIELFEEAKTDNDFYCNTLSQHLLKNKELVSKAHKHDFYLCVYISKGSGVHEIDFNKYDIKDGSIFILRPGQIHHWEFYTEPKGYIFIHTHSFYDLFFTHSNLDQFPFYYSDKNTPCLYLNDSSAKSFDVHFKQLYNEYLARLPFKGQRLHSLVNLLYIDIARKYAINEKIEFHPSVHYVRLLKKLEKLIEADYKKEKSVEYYANKLNISSKHLNRVVKITLDKTTSDLINERIILEAKRLLIHSTYNLNELAELLGYKDYAYFSRVFKQRTKYTPSDFKKNYE